MRSATYTIAFGKHHPTLNLVCKNVHAASINKNRKDYRCKKKSFMLKI